MPSNIKGSAPKKPCEICEKVFKYVPYQLRGGGAKYCSNPCRYKAQAINRKGIRPPQLTSEVIIASNKKHKIGKPLLKARHKRESITGSKHWNWRGGVAVINKTKRQRFMESFEYKQWRMSVFRRDNFTCQVCDVTGGTLHADHIKSYAKHPELRLEGTNGRTLCVPCHYYVTFKRKMLPGNTWSGYTLKEIK